jgi:hypothetical protein
MDFAQFAVQSDEYIRCAIAADRIPSAFLVDDEMWNRIRAICLQNQESLGFDELNRLERRRIEGFCKKSEHEIRTAILELNVPVEVLTDAIGWKRICYVRSCFRREIGKVIWQAVCSMRGEAGVSPRPTGVHE